MNERQGVLDCELERQGYSRQVAMKTPSMLSAPFIIEQSDLLMALPRRARRRWPRRPADHFPAAVSGSAV